MREPCIILHSQEKKKKEKLREAEKQITRWRKKISSVKRLKLHAEKQVGTLVFQSEEEEEEAEEGYLGVDIS